jgi:hypothetical protein
MAELFFALELKMLWCTEAGERSAALLKLRAPRQIRALEQAA